MILELEVAFETEEGYQYIIGFKEVNSVPDNYNIKLVDVTIALISENIESNSLKTLNKFIDIILDFLSKNDVILYYYCDIVPIKIRTNRKNIFSPQEFRFTLFSKMFNKQKSEKFYLQDIIIEDEAGGNHYVSLISRISNKETVELVKQDIEKFNK